MGKKAGVGWGGGGREGGEGVAEELGGCGFQRVCGISVQHSKAGSSEARELMLILVYTCFFLSPRPSWHDTSMFAPPTRNF